MIFLQLKLAIGEGNVRVEVVSNDGSSNKLFIVPIELLEDLIEVLTERAQQA
jgi:hypothetical protein